MANQKELIPAQNKTDNALSPGSENEPINFEEQINKFVNYRYHRRRMPVLKQSTAHTAPRSGEMQTSTLNLPFGAQFRPGSGYRISPIRSFNACPTPLICPGCVQSGYLAPRT